MTVGGTQMPARVSTGDRDAVLRQKTVVRGRSDTGELSLLLVENPVGNVEPMQLVVQYLTKAAIKPPSSSVQHPL